MSCLAHTLQLTLKDGMKHPSTEPLISRARKLVNDVRKSSKANEAMVKKCGRTLIRDCSTRWNSTFDMLRRLLDVRAELNQVLEDLGMDTLLTSDWSKMENLVKLLEPFSVHTDQLQSDSQSLSQVVPCLLNLEAHLQTTTTGKQLALVLLKSLRERFAVILSPHCSQFDATPAAACLLDPSVSLVLQTPEMGPLRRAAEAFVLHLAAQYHQAASQDDDALIASQPAPHSAPAVLQKYRFLASRLQINASLINEPDGSRTNSLLTEMKAYAEAVKQVATETPLQFWSSREKNVYPKLAPVALDLVSAPASQAFVERIFSVCGLLSSGLRNRTTTSLERRVFLKINKKLLLDIDND